MNNSLLVILTTSLVFQSNCISNIITQKSLAKHTSAFEAFEPKAKDVTVIVTHATNADNETTQTTYEPMSQELTDYIAAEKELDIMLSVNTGLKGATLGIATALFEEFAMQYSLWGKSLLDKKTIVANALASFYILRYEENNATPISYIDIDSMKAKNNKLSDITIQRFAVSTISSYATHAITRLAFRAGRASESKK